jgi:hypothetical protein
MAVSWPLETASSFLSRETHHQHRCLLTYMHKHTRSTARMFSSKRDDGQVLDWGTKLGMSPYRHYKAINLSTCMYSATRDKLELKP